MSSRPSLNPEASSCIPLTCVHRSPPLTPSSVSQGQELGLFSAGTLLRLHPQLSPLPNGKSDLHNTAQWGGAGLGRKEECQVGPARISAEAGRGKAAGTVTWCVTDSWKLPVRRKENERKNSKRAERGRKYRNQGKGGMKKEAVWGSIFLCALFQILSSTKFCVFAVRDDVIILSGGPCLLIYAYGYTVYVSLSAGQVLLCMCTSTLSWLLWLCGNHRE